MNISIILLICGLGFWPFGLRLGNSGKKGNGISPELPDPETYYLTDDDGNVLTDDDGNRLTWQ